MDWNSLEIGDRVMVHDTEDSGQLLPGVVTVVRPASGSAEISIRVTPPGGRARTVQPQRLTVHHDPLKFDSQCWRCAGSGPATPVPARQRAHRG